MSGWGALPNSVIRDPSLAPHEKAVLLVISSHVGATAYPLSHARIAEECGCSVRTVQRAIPVLEQRGLLVVKPTFRGREQGPNEYRLTLPTSAMPQKGSDSQTPGGGQTVMPLVTEWPTEEEPLKKNQSRGSQATRATPAPATLEVTEGMRTWWKQRNRPDIDVARETESFLDHHRAKGTTFKDWPAAWRTWMNNAITYADRERARNPRRQPQQREVFPR